jgi:hypothetical protein
MKTGDRSVAWVRRAWAALVVCVLCVSLAAVLFRIDGFATLENETLVTVVYSSMIAALWLGLLCIALLTTVYVRRVLGKVRRTSAR